MSLDKGITGRREDDGSYQVWLDGPIRITDPSYITSRFPGVVPLDDLTVVFEAPGLWNVKATLMDRVPDDRTGSLVLQQVSCPTIPENSRTTRLGDVAVDTGHIALNAEKNGQIEDWESYSNEMLMPGPQAGEVIAIGNTLIVQSGVGDGQYPVYGTHDPRSGDLIRIAVDFTPSQAAWDLLYGGRK